MINITFCFIISVCPVTLKKSERFTLSEEFLIYFLLWSTYKSYRLPKSPLSSDVWALLKPPHEKGDISSGLIEPHLFSISLLCSDWPACSELPSFACEHCLLLFLVRRFQEQNVKTEMNTNVLFLTTNGNFSNLLSHVQIQSGIWEDLQQQGQQQGIYASKQTG